MHIIHLSAECYPAAKAGGLGDVVGALPKYLNQLGEFCEVIIPRYQTPWLDSQEYELVWEANAPIGKGEFHFKILKEKTNKLGFNLYVIEIPGRFDRPGVYVDPWSGHGYWDEFERSLSFQIAALEWIQSFNELPDILHCHDHHAGLVPFLTQQGLRYERLRRIPSVITVHNAEYHGSQDMGKADLLPEFVPQNYGYLEWEGRLNPLASALKCSWKITTVSQSYMQELGHNSNGLEGLFQWETGKSMGIVNGIDAEVWDPATDPLLDINFTAKGVKGGKAKNKKKICEQFGLNPNLPTISFIGRLVREKGADLLPDLFNHYLYGEHEVNFVLLGTGDPSLHEIFARMDNEHFGFFDATLEYNEKLAHEIYAGSDFIIMPSRVEPCGLNQLYALRYGAIPIVRSVGGLKDTVKDISEEDGYGIRFDDFTLQEAEHATERAIHLYHNKAEFQNIVRRIVKLDFSWSNSATKYVSMYKELIEKT